MRDPIRPLPVLLLLFTGCLAAPDVPDAPSEEELQAELLERALASLESGGSPEAEAYVAAAGPRAVPELRELLRDTDDPVLRGRISSLLLYAGEDADLTSEEIVDVLLFDLSRKEAHPYLGMKALAGILDLGEEAIPPLERAAETADARGLAARRLLSRLREESQ